MNAHQVREWFIRAEWYDVYDFIEFVSKHADDAADAQMFKGLCNTVLISELSGYRFVGDLITPITKDEELREIEEAIRASESEPLAGVNSHLQSALAKLSDRKAPDYRNSIKESISAVESLCCLIGGEKATLGQALKPVREKLGLHPAVEKAFSSLYGWTNDAGGIRHALMDESLPCDFDDAKYMLVSCSAFVNYLIAKVGKAGIWLEGKSHHAEL